jgi:riboflavin synthase
VLAHLRDPRSLRERIAPEEDSVFTGIVEELGEVVAVEEQPDAARLTVRGPQVAAGASRGDSIAINGVCLTVVALDGDTLAFDVVPETFARTSLGKLQGGANVNVEPSLRAGDAMGGHYVQGHVDGVATVRALEPEGDGKRVWLDLPSDLRRYAAEKGSIAIEGTSLTIAAVDGAGIAVALIPHTLHATTLGAVAAGDRVNVEVDVLAKYVERLLPPG